MLELVHPGDPAYESLRHVYTATGTPAAIFRPRSAAEVGEALAVARSIGGPLAIRSGGHGVSSVATNVGGTVIDLGRLNSIERLDSGLVRIGPGARWGEVARRLGPWGLAISSGDSGDVGVGGLATTGGVGLMGRAQGLTIDRLRAAELVTADSQVLRLSATENPDLFWGVRGAGGNLGIVTSFDFEAAPTPIVARMLAGYSAPATGTASFLEAWGETVEAAPREISAFLYAFDGGGPGAQATVVFAGEDVEAARTALEPFARLPGAVGTQAELVPYAEVPLTTGAPHMGQQRAITHTGLADHLDGATTRAIADLLASQAAGMVQIRSVGGAINEAWAPVRELMSAIYLSFETDHSPDDVERAFPPATLERLRRIKAEWDPDDVFDQNFDVTY